MNETTLSERLAAVRQRIQDAEVRYGRPPESVGLVAVSKTCPADRVLACHQLGQKAFGENYLQEAVSKIESSGGLDLEWHFIGPLQANKSRKVAELFDWVHTIDRFRIARRLSDQRPDDRPALNVCVEVHVSAEASKHGVLPDELTALAEAVADLPRLRLRGLMAIPEAQTGFDDQRRTFARLRELQESLCRRGLDLDTLSMGMSADLEAAIAEGATLVRIGTAIFGPRN